MASITSLGVGSGLDLTSLLDQLREAEQQKLVPIQQQVESEEAKISAYGQLKGGLSQLQTAASALNNPELYGGLTTSVEGDGVRATSSDEAQPGQYAVEVEQLATAGSLATERVTAPDETIIDGDTELTFTLADGELDPIAIASGSSLEGIRDAINTESDGRLNASIINDGEGYRLSVNATETGADASIQSTNFSDILATDVTTSDAQVVQEGQNARINVNGIGIVSSSNQIEGAIQGVTLDLNEANTSNTITIAQDNQAIKEGVQAFVEAFNTLKSSIGDLTAFDAASGQAGQLNGDSATRVVESTLRGVLSGMMEGEGLQTLSDVGISLQVDGTLELDENKLDNVIGNEPDALANFFTGADSKSGMAGQVNEAIGQMLNDSGTLQSAISGSERRVESFGERFSRTEGRIEETVERYRTQFAQLDTLMSQMNSTSSYLTQQLSGLNQQPSQN
ncbi:Flagellar hook-associated protein 2 [Halomonas sp. NYA30]